MPEPLLIGLTLVLVIGMAAQWLAWILRLPSILLLLVFGFVVGPERLGLVDPDALLGDLLLPVVSISAALILFEGGLSLTVKELAGSGRVVGRLVTVGVLVTWVLAAAAAYALYGLPLGISVLLGAILSVSGPTVVQPLLRHIRPRGSTASILQWEGIVIDPIGAMLAVVVFEGLVLGVFREAIGHAALAIVETFLIGAAIGGLSAFALLHLLRRYWIPDWLHNPVALAVVVGAFTASNLIVEDSGLVTVTLLGVVLANRADVSVRHIVEFKENLRVLLLSGVFVLLAARLHLADFAGLDWKALLFLGWLVLVVRPLGVWLSTIGSNLSFRERLFLAWVFPRGIVAAAVASVFALRLEGQPGADLLVPLTFLVIVGTVLVYGFTSAPLARRLGLSTPNPQGVLMVGAHAWARQIAAALVAENIRVLLVDTNRANLRTARMEGLKTWYGSALAEHALEEIDFSDMGRLFVLTPNDEVNTLTSLHYLHEFGRERVYQLVSEKGTSTRRETTPTEFRGRTLFAGDATYMSLGARFARGGKVKATPITDKFTMEDFQTMYGEKALPLMTLQNGRLTVNTVDKPLKPSPGQTLIAIVEEEAATRKGPAATNGPGPAGHMPPRAPRT